MAFMVNLWDIYLCLRYKSYDIFFYCTADKNWLIQYWFFSIVLLLMILKLQSALRNEFLIREMWAIILRDEQNNEQVNSGGFCDYVYKMISIAIRCYHLHATVTIVLDFNQYRLFYIRT